MSTAPAPNRKLCVRVSANCKTIDRLTRRLQAEVYVEDYIFGDKAYHGYYYADKGTGVEFAPCRRAHATQVKRGEVTEHRYETEELGYEAPPGRAE